MDVRGGQKLGAAVAQSRDGPRLAALRARPILAAIITPEVATALAASIPASAEGRRSTRENIIHRPTLRRHHNV
jgi:hypothetical protein